MLRRCDKCKRDLPFAQFHETVLTKSGMSKKCKDCNPVAPYIPPKRPARRKRGLDRRSTAAALRDLCEEYGHRCLRCGARGHALACDPLDGVELFAARIIPEALGGAREKDNFQPLCTECIRQRAPGDATDWRGTAGERPEGT